MIDLNKRVNEICETIFIRYDRELAKRLYTYISNKWFLPSTPILHNFGKEHGLPISCFVNHVGDRMENIKDSYSEAFEYARLGGGVGTYWGDVREIGASIRGVSSQHKGIIPFLKVQDSMSLAINQTNIRSGSTAVYLNVWHPEIEEFINIRNITGGDNNRRCLNLHHGVIIDDVFMKAVIENDVYHLKSIVTNNTVRTVRARDLWESILTTRIETGEPFIIFIDNVNNSLPPLPENKKVYTSNLCTEILQPTSCVSPAICCLASLNIEKWFEYDSCLDKVVKDILIFLDCVINEFLEKTELNYTLSNTVNSVLQSRAVGLGVMGYHSFLQSLNIPFDSLLSKSWNKKIFHQLNTACNEANKQLGLELGVCPDTEFTSFPRRFTFTQAIAPTATISSHFETSPGIDPYVSNIFNHKNQKGNFVSTNKHLYKLLSEKVGEENVTEELKKIKANNGSVMECKFLEDKEKEIFKTSYEIDQRWIVELAGDRSKYIDQGQSVNLFFSADTKKGDLNKIHLEAWKKGVKSLYYCRSKAIKRAKIIGEENYKECLACQ